MASLLLLITTHLISSIFIILISISNNKNKPIKLNYLHYYQSQQGGQLSATSFNSAPSHMKHCTSSQQSMALSTNSCWVQSPSLSSIALMLPRNSYTLTKIKPSVTTLATTAKARPFVLTDLVGARSAGKELDDI